MQLLLISNSTNPGGGYLDHCAEEIVDFTQGVKEVLFIPFAMFDRDTYARKTCARLAEMGLRCRSLHEAPKLMSAVKEAQVIFVGGGNTFRLLTTLYATRLLAGIRHRVESGALYIGSSAGVNIACPTIKTTNDMPIVEPPSFEALGLIPFNVNTHYADRDPDSTHQGETRELRIREFHEENPEAVVGLREGALLRVNDREIKLKGSAGARLFLRNEPPEDFAPGSNLDFLLQATVRTASAG